MNWYYEKEGVSQGPVAEADLAERVWKRELKADSLIWNPEQESWAPVAEIRPAWLETLQEEPETPMAGEVSRQEPEIEGEAALMPVKLLREVPVHAAAAPAPSRLKPQAPVGGKEEKPGFLKRLFGGGKK